MPNVEHSVVVPTPVEHVAAALSAPAAEPLFTPSIVRIALDASADGRAADLTVEQLRTATTGPRDRSSRPPARTSDGAVHVGASFAGPGVEGALAYRLVPRDDATEVVQQVEYAIVGWATIDLLESATTAHNDRQFAVQLRTVKALLEAGSELLPAEQAGDEEGDSISIGSERSTSIGPERSASVDLERSTSVGPERSSRSGPATSGARDRFA